MRKSAAFILKIATILAVVRACFAIQGSHSSTFGPVWSIYNANHNACECYRYIGDHLRCNDEGYIVGLKDCSCSTYNWSSSVTTIGNYICGCNPPFHGISFETPNVSSIITTRCDLCKRNGTLCGTCHRETYPAVYSFSMTCIYCKHLTFSWITFLVWS